MFTESRDEVALVLFGTSGNYFICLYTVTHVQSTDVHLQCIKFVADFYVRGTQCVKHMVECRN